MQYSVKFVKNFSLKQFKNQHTNINLSRIEKMDELGMTRGNSGDSWLPEEKKANM